MRVASRRGWHSWRRLRSRWLLQCRSSTGPRIRHSRFSCSTNTAVCRRRVRRHAGEKQKLEPKRLRQIEIPVTDSCGASLVDATLGDIGGDTPVAHPTPGRHELMSSGPGFEMGVWRNSCGVSLYDRTREAVLRDRSAGGPGSRRRRIHVIDFRNRPAGTHTDNSRNDAQQKRNRKPSIVGPAPGPPNTMRKLVF